jgi:hypothetical protein
MPLLALSAVATLGLIMSPTPVVVMRSSSISMMAKNEEPAKKVRP